MYSRFTPSPKRTFGFEDDPYTSGASEPIIPSFEAQPAGMPLQSQNLLMNQKGPLNPMQNPFEPGGANPRPTFNPEARDIANTLPGPDYREPTASVAPKPGVLDRYNEIIQNRPQRKALEDMINNAPKREDYKPGAFDRIAASLGGFSAGFRDPGKGVAVARDIRDNKYNQAESTYQDKLKNVGALAGMESEDIQQRLKGFDLERGEERDTRDFKQKQDEFNANQKHREDTLKAQGWDFYTDETTGKRIGENSVTGERKELGKIAESREEKTKREADVAAALAKSHESIANIGAQSRNYGADVRAKTAAGKLAAAARQLKPGDVNQKAYNDAADILTLNDIDDNDTDKVYYVDENTNRIIVQPNKEPGKYFGSGDSPAVRKAKEELRAKLGETYKSGMGNEGNKPSAAGGKTIDNWVVR